MGDIGKETLFLTAGMRAGFRTELMALQEEKRQQRQGWGRSIVVRGYRSASWSAGAGKRAFILERKTIRCQTVERTRDTGLESWHVLPSGRGTLSLHASECHSDHFT